MNKTFLLLQMRDEDDPMRAHEVGAFARALSCRPERIRTWDLLSGRPGRRALEEADIILMGGAGAYSVVDGGPWLDEAMAAMRDLHALAKPTFASCWGFQAMARALGGTVEHRPDLAELSSTPIHLSPAARADPVFCGLDDPFLAHSAHEDTVTRLPPDGVLLGSSARVENLAFKFDEKPIYCTQFHPELTRDDIVARLRTYPKYVERLGGGSLAECMAAWEETPVSATIIRRFLDHLD